MKTSNIEGLSREELAEMRALQNECAHEGHGDERAQKLHDKLWAWSEELIAAAEREISLRNENARLKAAIRDEPEFPGAMPDEIWNAICVDRAACEHAMREAVRLTKQGILERAALP